MSGTCHWPWSRIRHLAMSTMCHVQSQSSSTWAGMVLLTYSRHESLNLGLLPGPLCPCMYTATDERYKREKESDAQLSTQPALTQSRPPEQHQQPDCRCFLQTVQLTLPNPHGGDANQTAQMSPSSRGFKDSSLKPSSTALSTGSICQAAFLSPWTPATPHQTPHIPIPHTVTPFLNMGHAVCPNKPCKTAKIYILNQYFSLVFQFKHLNILNVKPFCVI